MPCGAWGHQKPEGAEKDPSLQREHGSAATLILDSELRH